MKLKTVDGRHLLYLSAHFVLILIGVLLVFVPGGSIEALGWPLIAAGIAGYVVFGYVLVSQRTTDRIEMLQKFGVVGAFESRATRIRSEYAARVAEARDHIDVLAFGLSAMREDFIGEFEGWKARAEVRILLLDPNFPSEEGSFADQRDRDENNDSGKIRQDVEKFVRATAGLQDDRFKVRLYRCLPTVNIFRVDDEMLWGPYLVREQGRNTPTLVARSGVIFNALQRHFDEIWSSALSVEPPSSWLKEA